MAVKTYESPWILYPPGDYYLRHIDVIHTGGIEEVYVYTSTDFQGDPQEPTESKIFNPPFAGKRINFDSRTPFVKICVILIGEDLKVMDVFFGTKWARTV